MLFAKRRRADFEPARGFSLTDHNGIPGAQFAMKSLIAAGTLLQCHPSLKGLVNKLFVAIGVLDMTAKTCKLGHHPIGEEQGYVTYLSGFLEEYACFDCYRCECIRKFASDNVLTMNLGIDAVIRGHERKYIYDNFHNDSPGVLAQVAAYVEILARTLAQEEAAFSASPEAVPFPEAPFSEAFFCSNRQFWFDHFLDKMTPVEAIGKEWERAVWFGGEDRSEDDRYTEPYPGMPGFRQYRENPDGNEAYSSIRDAVLVPGSLQAFVIPAKYKYYVAQVGELRYNSSTLCGRSIFRIESPDAYVSCILDETSPKARGGLSSIYATSEQAVALFQQAIEDWRAGRIQLVKAP